MVPGSPEEVNACDATALRSILDAHDELPDDNGRTPSDATRVPDLNTGGDGDNAGSSGVIGVSAWAVEGSFTPRRTVTPFGNL